MFDDGLLGEGLFGRVFAHDDGELATGISKYRSLVDSL
jgi:hypothetical protein